MKRVLIAGANSFIGSSVERHLAKWPDQYQVDTVDVRVDHWKTQDFSAYHVVLFVAAIVHTKTDRLKGQALSQYQYVNTTLPFDFARRCKDAGVQQFIFMSSMSVYGEVGSVRTPVVISRKTAEKPNTPYGMSKLEAEKALESLATGHFRIAILRPPMVYGRHAKGNYQGLARFARTFRIFPDFPNKRSMLHIDGLTAFIKRLIDSMDAGLFYPQDAQFICTSQMVRDIAEEAGKKVYFTRIFNPVIRLLSGHVQVVDKVFGDLIYDPSLSEPLAKSETASSAI